MKLILDKNDILYHKGVDSFTHTCESSHNLSFSLNFSFGLWGFQQEDYWSPLIIK